ncbi:RagB/SusD family nutrient uptake outer membrane protein [Aestuariibaculum suncheonense]|uniref:RagB/SusD family nutrient uptake outer membrane protein n=1 Tax=Aestuariibaculum suncheonense TaxID=1028745 RepID=A0A8J6QW17_9FLAO|nr:RagB/SusD family nutrient uptake outer membrane protein [Aestuariibaculum suncheonense]MBD0836034.1 RagB/SusD family nutrient uptake outer membrane protein [Aestuariibaculum suncheonense]
MKKYIKYTLGLLGGLIIASCDNYLDIKPEDKFLEEQVFSSKEGISNALNGIYGSMISASGYGGNLTMSTVEVIGQRFKPLSNSSDWINLADYDYTNASVRNQFNAIWTELYTNILSMNNFLTGLDTYPGALTLEQENLLKGEVIGLRAMHHLDLLRLFGPIYSTNSDDLAIPYYTKPEAVANPLLTAKEVMDNILADLLMAEQLLENDPVRTDGSQAQDNAFIVETNDKHVLARNNRLNYYAVKALQARAYLYAGNTPLALAAAKAVIDEATPWFPWTARSDVFGAGGSPDRIMSKEVLFSTINTALYGRQNSYFSASLPDSSILVPDEDRLEEVFESSLDDYRFASSWDLPVSGAKDYKTFFKFADITDTDKDDIHIKFMQPLIRISEMYYIAAETEIDPDLALGYLNTVRNNRGLTSLDSQSVTDIQIEIQKEIQKEFFGEGQLFFYYKRLNLDKIPNGKQATGTLTMGPDQYVVPLPLSETEYR